jgi:hypothetical protein
MRFLRFFTKAKKNRGVIFEFSDFRQNRVWVKNLHVIQKCKSSKSCIDSCLKFVAIWNHLMDWLNTPTARFGLERGYGVCDAVWFEALRRKSQSTSTSSAKPLNFCCWLLSSRGNNIWLRFGFLFAVRVQTRPMSLYLFLSTVFSPVFSFPHPLLTSSTLNYSIEFRFLRAHAMFRTYWTIHRVIWTNAIKRESH